MWLLEVHAPICTIGMRCKPCPWIVKDILVKCHERNKTRRVFNSAKSDEDDSSYYIIELKICAAMPYYHQLFSRNQLPFQLWERIYQLGVTNLEAQDMRVTMVLEDFNKFIASLISINLVINSDFVVNSIIDQFVHALLDDRFFFSVVIPCEISKAVLSVRKNQ